MASERDNMMGIANNYIAKVSGAKANCEDAIRQIKNAMPDIEANWKGESGSAMIAALEALIVSIQAKASELSETIGAMHSDAQRIYSSWPADDPVEGEGAAK